MIKSILGAALSAIYMPLNLFMGLIAWILAPILPFFATDDGWLPDWLWWFQTPDYSLDGDSSWKDPTKHPYISKLPRYWRRVFWLYRNPAYQFNWSVLATSYLKENAIIYGNIDADCKTGKMGWCYCRSGMWYEFKWYTETVFGKCLKFRIGWAMSSAISDDNYVNKKFKYCFTCNPFKSIT
jgi:hypothetical protein